MRRLFSLLGWITFATIVVATGVVIAIDVGFQRDRLRDLGQSLALRELGLEIAVDRIDGRASRGLELRGLRIGPPEAPLAEIDRVRAEWRIWRWLLDDERRIERIEIEGARLALERAAEGRWRTLDDVLDRLAARTESPTPAAGTEAPPPITVGTLTVRDSQIAVTLAATAADGARAAEADAGNDPAADFDRLVFALEAEGMDLRSRAETALPVERADVRLTLVEATRAGEALPLLDDAEIVAGLTASGRLQATVEARGPGLALDAEVDGTTRAPGPVRFALRVDDLAPLARWLPDAADLRGRARIEGELEGFRLDGPIAFDPDALTARLALDAALEGLPPVQGRVLPAGRLTVEGRGRLEAGRLAIEELVIGHARGLRMTGKGRMTRTALDDVTLAVTLDDVAAWAKALAPEVMALRGERIELRADLEGPIESPIGRLVANARGVALADVSPSDFTLFLEREGRGPARLRASVREVGARSASANAELAPLRIDATLDPAGRDGAFEATVDGGFLTRMGFVPTAVAGRFALSGEADRDAAGLHGEVRLEGEDVVLDATPLGAVALTTRTRAPATPERIELALTRFEAGIGDARSPRLALARPTVVAFDAARRWRIDGLALALDFGDAASTDAIGATDSPREADPARGASTTLALDARGRDRALEAASLVIAALPIEAITERFETPARVGGRLALEAQLETRGGRLVTQGRGELASPKLAGRTFEAASFSWATEEDATTARLAVAADTGAPLDVEARMPLLPADPAQLGEALRDETTFTATLDGFDLALLAPAIPRTLRDPAGRLRGRLDGRIADGRPRLSGRLDVEEAGITVPLLRRRFAPLNGYAVLEGERLTLRDLRLGSEAAGARLMAAIDLDPEAGLPIDAELTLHDLPISRSPLLHADVDGRLTVGGSLAEPTIEGRLTLPGVQVRVPAAQDPLLREIRLTATTGDALVEPAPGSNDFVTSSFIDVRLEVPGDARIRGQGAHLYVKGNARIASRPGEALRVFGEGEVVNGTYTLQGRRFQVRRGSVKLVGDREVDPVLDVEARLPTGDIVAIVDVTGRLSSPIVRLRSEPSRSEQDVLAYLLFGRPAEEVGASQSGSMDAAAARLVAGVAERELREILGDAMPVDSIEIGADDEGNTSELGFGKYLRPNLYLRYVHTLGDEPADRVGVEYRVNDLISVGSSVSTTGDAGLDLILRRDF